MFQNYAAVLKGRNPPESNALLWAARQPLAELQEGFSHSLGCHHLVLLSTPAFPIVLSILLKFLFQGGLMRHSQLM